MMATNDQRRVNADVSAKKNVHGPGTARSKIGEGRSLRESTSVGRRKLGKQYLLRFLYLALSDDVAILEAQIDEIDKENREPSPAAVAALRRKVRKVTNAFAMAKAEQDSETADIRRDIKLLKEGQAVMQRPDITVGLAQMRDDWITEMLKRKRADGTRVKLSDMDEGNVNADVKKSYSNSTRLHAWAKSWAKESVFKEFLKERDIVELLTYHKDLDNQAAREARNAETHDNQHEIYAYAVVHGAALNDRACVDHIARYETMFRFTYDDKTFQQAADEHKNRPLR